MRPSRAGDPFEVPPRLLLAGFGAANQAVARALVARDHDLIVFDDRGDSAVVTAAASAVGASFVAATVIVTVAAGESTVPSLAVYVKLSAPLKSAPGVYVKLGAVPLSDPLAGPATTA